MDYLQIPAHQLGKDARLPLLCLGDSGEVFYELALAMIAEIKENNAAGKPTVLIVPVGPVGQYPIFVRLVNRDRISLRSCWFINMDEYLGEDDKWVPTEHRLSFRGFMEREVYRRIDPALVLPPDQRIFPDPADPGRIAQVIRQLGGVDMTIGGIGINGHLAFNEPQPELSPEEFAALSTRVLDIACETRTVNAVGELGGAYDAMPKRCVTVGMAEILSARKLRLACFRDWHRSVVRRTAYGDVTASFPATLAQRHPDALLLINANCAQQPF